MIALLLLTWTRLSVFPAPAEAQDSARPDGIVGFDQVVEFARRTAARPYKPSPELPPGLKDITYDLYKMISFDVKKPIWLNHKRPVWLETFHRGYVHQDQVSLNIIADGKENHLPFTKDLFEYRQDAKKLDIQGDLGFAGMRLVGTFPEYPERQEFVAFLGSSYFRARDAENVYGSSTRGLAIDIGLPKTEEFPIFREFWIVKPQPDDPDVTIYALLDSPSVAGAYHFVLKPGIKQTTLDIRATLFFRKAVEKVGFAPLTSMWMWGDGLSGPKGDPRPEVHDADGLLIQAGDTWNWRAVSRQEYPSVVRMPYTDIRGFGVVQRDRNVDHYRDQEAMYHRRPSVWIEPQGNWGAGAIELLELDAPHEGIDNVAVWWVPERVDQSGAPVNLQYRVSFFSGDPPGHTLGKATAFRVVRHSPELMDVEVDFAGTALAELPADTKLSVEVGSVRAEVKSATCQKNDGGSWTAKLAVRPTREGPIELKATVKSQGQALTETWSYLCPLNVPPVSIPPWRLKEMEGKVKE
jgi:glucans biosynthesis protein